MSHLDSNTAPAATVVIPVYGRLELLRPVLEAFVREAVESDFELVLVDDGSDPAAAPLLASLNAPASFRCVRHDVNRGRGAALNTGLENARGAVVIFCDADVVPAPGFVEEHLAFHREHPSELATHLGELAWGVDPGLYGRLLGPRSNPRLVGHRGAVGWQMWFTDNWSFKRRLLADRGLRFDPFFQRWGWEELELARRLEAVGATNTITGTACGLHLKPSSLDGAMRSFARSVPNLLHLARGAQGDPDVSNFLIHRCATERACAAAEAFVRAMWQRCEELDTRLASRGGLMDVGAGTVSELATALSDAVFGVGIARGFLDETSEADLAGIELERSSDVRVVGDLSALAGQVYLAGARLDDLSASDQHLRTHVADLLETSGLKCTDTEAFWDRLERDALRAVPPQATRPSQPNVPDISVLVPTYGRPERIEKLLAELNRQTLASSRFEVIVVDDGSAEPIALDAHAYTFALTLLRQKNSGPGGARNFGLERCRAALVLILNDDAVPAADLLEKHLQAHAEASQHVAVMGSFHFTQESMRSPFVQVLENSNLLFDFPGLRHGELHDWRFFWTCNLSLSTVELRAVGGFDAERFREAIVEDCELGYRLQRRGLKVLYREDLVCEHEHALDSESYLRRMHRLGVNLGRMYKKHRDPAILWCESGADIERELLPKVQATSESFHGPFEALRVTLRSFEAEYAGRAVPEARLEQVRQLLKRIGLVPYYRGLLEELEGHDILSVIEHGAARGRLTSLIVVSYQALEQTRRCLESLRRSGEANHPTEILFVDNGSTDGTAEYLGAQADVRLIRNANNLGAPRARNQALEEARGETIVFLDNDVQVTPGWLGRLLYHAEVDHQSGCISCLADRAGHDQQIELPVASDPVSLASFAGDLARRNRRQFRSVGMLSSFLLLVRREVVDAIGGFDERFTPWGFEDDDYTLRAHLAGFRNRLALDVFVRHEPYAGPKAARHQQLLLRNWARFCAKWGRPIGTPYGKYDGLAALEQLKWAAGELFLPFHEQPSIGESVLAWPNYADAREVGKLFAEIAAVLADGDGRELVLRVDPALDGPVDAILSTLDAAFRDAVGTTRALSVSLLDDADSALATAKALVSCSTVSTTGSARKNAAWLDKTGLAPLPGSRA